MGGHAGKWRWIREGWESRGEEVTAPVKGTVDEGSSTFLPLLKVVYNRYLLITGKSVPSNKEGTSSKIRMARRNTLCTFFSIDPAPLFRLIYLLVS